MFDGMRRMVDLQARGQEGQRKALLGQRQAADIDQIMIAVSRFATSFGGYPGQKLDHSFGPMAGTNRRSW